MKLFSAIIPVLLLAACGREGPRVTEVPLTADEIISVYHVAVGAIPARKIEWRSTDAEYTQIIVESRQGKDGPWKILLDPSANLPSKRRWLILSFDPERTKDGHPAKKWILNVRLGYEGALLSGWSVSNMEMDEPETPYQTVSSLDSKQLFLLSTSHGQIRVRAESSANKFGGI